MHGPIPFNVLSKHSKIEFKGLRLSSSQLVKIAMLGIKQSIPFSTNGGGRHEQRNGLSAPDPPITNGF